MGNHNLICPDLLGKMANKKAKNNTEGMAHQLSLVIKSGKIVMGRKESLRAVRNGEAKLVIVSSNCPSLRASEFEYYAMLAKIGVHRFQGTNTELGTACGKMFRASVIAITDIGNSDIIKTVSV